jgi:hypothetical protein
MWFFFRVPPAGRSVVSIVLSGHSFENATGSVFLHVFGTEGPGFISVPVDGSFGQHTVDFTFVPPAAPEPLEIIMEYSELIEEMAFTGVSLGPEPLWIEPEPPIA